MSVDLGEPFVVFVNLDAKKVKFSFKFNKEELDSYLVPISYADIWDIHLSGDMELNFVGFADPGKYSHIFPD